MGRFIDKVCLVVATSIIAMIIALTVARNIAVTIAVGIITSILTILIVRHKANNTPKKYISWKAFDTYMIIKGQKCQLDTLKSLYKDSIIKDGYIEYDGKMLIPIFSFGALGKGDILKAYNKAKDNNIDKIYIISNNIDRTSVLFSNVLYDREFYFVRAKEVYNALKDNGLLPIMPPKVKKAKLPIKELLLLLVARENAPRFLFTAFILFVIGLLTPLRTYYMTLSAISAILCLVSILSKDRNVSNKKLPTINK